MPKDNQSQSGATPETPAPVAEAPVVATPQQPVVQQVVMQQSLKGLGGWLIFWMIVFALGGVGYIYTFFALLTVGDAGPATGLRIISLIFDPLLAIGYLASVILIAMQKKLGWLSSLVTIGVSALYSVLTIILTYATANSVSSSYDSTYGTTVSSSTQQSLALVIAGVLVTVIVHGLVALYFVVSKRVKETLVN